MTVHPGFVAGTDGRRIAEILMEEGLSADRIVIAHADAFIVPTALPRLVLGELSWALDLDYHRELLAAGVNLSFDCFGQSWTDEVNDVVSERDWAPPGRRRRTAEGRGTPGSSCSRTTCS